MPRCPACVSMLRRLLKLNRANTHHLRSEISMVSLRAPVALQYFAAILTARFHAMTVSQDRAACALRDHCHGLSECRRCDRQGRSIDRCRRKQLGSAVCGLWICRHWLRNGRARTVGSAAISSIPRVKMPNKQPDSKADENHSQRNHETYGKMLGLSAFWWDRILHRVEGVRRLRC